MFFLLLHFYFTCKFSIYERCIACQSFCWEVFNLSNFFVCLSCVCYICNTFLSWPLSLGEWFYVSEAYHLPVSLLETVKAASPTFWLSSKKKAGFFSKFQNTVNCTQTKDRREKGRGTLFSEALDLLVAYLSLAFSSAALCQVGKRKPQPLHIDFQRAEGQTVIAQLLWEP